MTMLFVRHKIADYDTWRKTYDAFEGEREAHGVTHQSVFRTADDPNDITVCHEFPSMDSAKAFAGSEKLKSAMMQAGVQGAPDMWFTERA